MRGRHRRLRRRVVHRRLGDLRDLLRDRLLCLFDRRQVALKHALLDGRVDGRLLQAEIVLCQALERGVEELDELGLRLEDPVCCRKGDGVRNIVEMMRVARERVSVHSPVNGCFGVGVHDRGVQELLGHAAPQRPMLEHGLQVAHTRLERVLIADL